MKTLTSFSFEKILQLFTGAEVDSGGYLLTRGTTR